MSVALMSHRGALDPGRWSPQQLGTLSLWLDADDPTTITLATGVSEWRDKSGNARNATMSVGSQQPTWARSVQGGRAAVTATKSSNQTLPMTDTLDILTGGLSIAVVYAPLNSVNTIVSKVNGTVGTNGEWVFDTDTFAVHIGGNSRSTLGASTTDGSWHIDSGVLDRSASVTRWRDGTRTGNIVTGGFPNTTSYDVAAVSVVCGRTNDSGNNSFNGKVGEIIVSLSTWSTTDRQKVEGYLAHKWGLTSLLPANHPHKSIAP